MTTPSGSVISEPQAQGVDFESTEFKGGINLILPGPNVELGDVGGTPTTLESKLSLFLPHDLATKQGHFLTWQGNNIFGPGQTLTAPSNILSWKYVRDINLLPGFFSLGAGLTQTRDVNPNFGSCPEGEECSKYRSQFGAQLPIGYQFFENNQITGRLPMVGLSYIPTFSGDPVGLATHGAQLVFNVDEALNPGLGIFVQGGYGLTSAPGLKGDPNDNTWTHQPSLALIFNPNSDPMTVERTVYRLASAYTHTDSPEDPSSDIDLRSHELQAEFTIGQAFPGQELTPLTLSQVADGFELPITLGVGFKWSDEARFGDEGIRILSEDRFVSAEELGLEGDCQSELNPLPHVAVCEAELIHDQQSLVTLNAGLLGDATLFRSIWPNQPDWVSAFNIQVNGQVGLDLNGLSQNPISDQFVFGGTVSIGAQFKGANAAQRQTVARTGRLEELARHRDRLRGDLDYFQEGPDHQRIIAELDLLQTESLWIRQQLRLEEIETALEEGATEIERLRSKLERDPQNSRSDDWARDKRSFETTQLRLEREKEDVQRRMLEAQSRFEELMSQFEP